MSSRLPVFKFVLYLNLETSIVHLCRCMRISQWPVRDRPCIVGILYCCVANTCSLAAWVIAADQSYDNVLAATYIHFEIISISRQTTKQFWQVSTFHAAFVLWIWQKLTRSKLRGFLCVFIEFCNRELILQLISFHPSSIGVIYVYAVFF